MNMSFKYLFRYKKAVWWFEKTLAHVPSSLSEMWEPTVVNLAHALRKLKYVYFSLKFFAKDINWLHLYYLLPFNYEIH